MSAQTSPSKEIRFAVSGVIDPRVDDRLLLGLTENAHAAGIVEGKIDLCVTARDIRGGLIGALTGNSLGPWLYIARLWVDRPHRGRGIGAALLAAAESEAANRGCLTCFLHTFQYEAPDFYLKHGYRKIATLRHPRIDHERYYMQKDLPGCD